MTEQKPRELPFIEIVKTMRNPEGVTLETTVVTVKAKTLKECRNAAEKLMDKYLKERA